jgi:membrane-associated protease RseP (regulator of RpoE activity)
MAIVGPFTSIVLGIVFLLVAGAAGGLPPNAATDPSAALAGLDPITTILLWLGPVNILLGLFNLIPGFPLDGGLVVVGIAAGLLGQERKPTAVQWSRKENPMNALRDDDPAILTRPVPTLQRQPPKVACRPIRRRRR